MHVQKLGMGLNRKLINRIVQSNIGCNMNAAEFNNWFKIELLLVKASECLRKTFEQCWQRKYKVAWSNTPECGKHFTKSVGSNVYRQSRSKAQKKHMESGDIRKWDLTLLNAIFTSTDLNRDKAFQDNLRRLMPIRNSMAHHSDKNISNQEYQKYWNELKGILLFLGITDEELDDILHSHSSDSKLYVLNTNVKKSVELKQEGNNLLKEQKFQKAATKYTDAIVLPGIPDEDLSILYSNRSLSYLKLGKYTEALEDAKQSKRLNPDYIKAYIRLGKAYEALRKYDKAVKNFDKALSLDMHNEDIRKMRSEARRLKGLQERDNDESLKELALKDGQKLKNMKNRDEFKKDDVQLQSSTGACLGRSRIPRQSKLFHGRRMLQTGSRYGQCRRHVQSGSVHDQRARRQQRLPTGA